MRSGNVLFLTIIGTIIIGAGTAILVQAKEEEIVIKPIEIPYGKNINAAVIEKQLEKQGIIDVKIIKGKIEPEKIGEYSLTLQLTKEDNEIFEKVVKIDVTDEVPPEITVKKVEIEAGSIFNLTDYVDVIDNADGDLTGIITYKPVDTKDLGEQKLEIASTDYSGNKTNKKIILSVIDTTKPTLNVTDEKINFGAKFNAMENSSATDLIDGNLTSEMQVTGTVDPNTAGTYTLLYTVSDKSGNKVEKERNVIVEAAPVADNVEPEATKANANETNPETDTSSDVNSEAEAVTPVPISNPDPITQPPAPSYAPMTIYVGGSAIPYQNGGQGSGQSIIDNAPIASTWGGAAIQSGSDGLNTHIIGHNPGVFSALFNVGIGSQVTITDGNGTPTNYTINRVYEVNDNAVGVRDGVDYWDQMIGTGGGERVTFQTCENDNVNWVYEAVS
ncbi:immunoglobulin-like domain-containing protein [Carnobacterium maltaromaticum]|uniref:immunoglobulin-like domain-containing protein n=1 Tax=Carnobacterium maltaromaticum TaxID=2751 RepID=UPI0012F8CC25|nr:immunoglobulin-like domain-containing protein [Carnobacterium maltaromaticum]